MSDYHTRNNTPGTQRPMLHCYVHCSGPAIQIGVKLDSNGQTRIVRLYGPPTRHVFVEMRSVGIAGPGLRSLEWAPFYRCTVCQTERRWG